jgi:predicted secreted acid phosphatase
VLIDEEKERFIQIIETLKTTTHYVSSLKKRSKDQDLKGMKSHDYHIMMQKILLLCMRHLMTKEYRMAIIRLCWVFKRLWIWQ